MAEVDILQLLAELIMYQLHLGAAGEERMVLRNGLPDTLAALVGPRREVNPGLIRLDILIICIEELSQCVVQLLILTGCLAQTLQVEARCLGGNRVADDHFPIDEVEWVLLRRKFNIGISFVISVLLHFFGGELRRVRLKKRTASLRLI